MRSLFGGSAIAAALLTTSVLFYARPLAAEPAKHLPQPTPTQQEKLDEAETTETSATTTPQTSVSDHVKATEAVVPVMANEVGAPPAATAKEKAENASPEATTAPPLDYVATAYSLPGRGASGMRVTRGLIAADPRVLPFGTRVRLDAGQYSGEYIVGDSGSAVKGRKIDIWMPSNGEACRFGRRKVKLTVLSYGPRRAPRSRRR
jgi:3D (Asp-Asp-Asp) domain-containing protein